MADCERLESCSFFNNRMENQPATAELYKKRYCKGNNSECARHYMMNYLEKNNYEVDNETELKIAELTETLFPNQLEKIQQILF